MRDIKTLLQIVIDSLKEGFKQGFYNSGICGQVHDLKCEGKISTSERDYLYQVIESNKPSINIEFFKYTKSEHWIGDIWWWKKMRTNPETRQIRIDYLIQLKESL